MQCHASRKLVVIRNWGRGPVLGDSERELDIKGSKANRESRINYWKLT